MSEDDLSRVDTTVRRLYVVTSRCERIERRPIYGMMDDGKHYVWTWRLGGKTIYMAARMDGPCETLFLSWGQARSFMIGMLHGRRDSIIDNLSRANEALAKAEAIPEVEPV